MGVNRSAVFLDRDGTISREVGYIDNADDFELYPDAVESLKTLKNIGFSLIVVTNQSGVARGYFPVERVDEINAKMRKILLDKGITLDAVYFCPHHKEGIVAEYAIECDCRKPAIGMIDRGKKELAISTGGSWMIGDNISDIQCGINAGLNTILVRTGHGIENEKKIGSLPENQRPGYVVDTLGDAVKIIKESNGS